MRRLTKKNIQEILEDRFKNDDYKTLSSLPQPTEFKDIIKATKRVIDAIENNQKILLVGDYDVDGIVSTTLILDFFEIIDYKIEYIIPNRFKNGYGITVDLIKDFDCDVIITVDNGISAVQVGDYCEENGIDLIITDHHLPPQIQPKAYATINQKQKDCNFPIYEICGAQVAWYFIASLKINMKLKFDMKQFLDLVSIAIIADVMPLNKINRVLVKEGLNILNTTTRPCIKIIRDIMTISKVTSETVGFFIAPKINSTGRLKDASLGVDFLRAKSEDDAIFYYEQLDQLNNQRKEIEQSITNQAFAKVSLNDKILVVWGKEWHEGVVGIVASRLADKYKKPAIVLSLENGKAKGSARSVGNVDIHRLLTNCSELLEGFGGHKKAGGLSLKESNLEDFKKLINLEVLNIYEDEDFIEPLDICGELFLNHIDLELLDIMESYEPYGEANPRLTFVMNNIQALNVKKLGQNSDLLKFNIIDRKNRINLNCIKFKSEDNIKENDIVSFTYKLTKNEFRGAIYVQLVIEEFL
jgi:single-stranded-DNA-specific exonuclease